MNIPYDKEFVFHDGSRAKNIEELLQKIKSLDSQEFSSFVNSEKNDFANWIEQVLMIDNVGKELRKTLSKDQTILLLERYLKEGKKITKQNFDLFSLFKFKNNKRIDKKGIDKKQKNEEDHYFFINDKKNKKMHYKDVNIIKKNSLISWYNIMKSKKDTLKEKVVKRKISEAFLWRIIYSFLILLILLIIVYRIFFRMIN